MKKRCSGPACLLCLTDSRGHAGVCWGLQVAAVCCLLLLSLLTADPLESMLRRKLAAVAAGNSILDVKALYAGVSPFQLWRQCMLVFTALAPAKCVASFRAAKQMHGVLRFRSCGRTHSWVLPGKLANNSREQDVVRLPKKSIKIDCQYLGLASTSGSLYLCLKD